MQLMRNRLDSLRPLDPAEGDYSVLGLRTMQ